MDIRRLQFLPAYLIVLFASMQLSLQVCRANQITDQLEKRPRSQSDKETKVDSTPQRFQVHNQSLPVYHIPLRVHLQDSWLDNEELVQVLEDINMIWSTQAGICFDIETVLDDEALEDGLDLWFHRHIRGWNGYYAHEHDIHVRDHPELAEADLPAATRGGRTAAHELGHALGLSHRQNSDDNLMRSKTLGWQLNHIEILHARRNATGLAVRQGLELACRPAELADRAPLPHIAVQ